MTRRLVALLIGSCAFVFVLASTVVVLRAEGDYNSGGGWCEHHDFLDNPVFWYLYECWKPAPPSPPM